MVQTPPRHIILINGAGCEFEIWLSAIILIPGVFCFFLQLFFFHFQVLLLHDVHGANSWFGLSHVRDDFC